MPATGAERLLLREHVIDRAPHGSELVGIERRCAIHRGEPGGGEQRVAFAQRDVECAGEREHDLATRL